MEFETRSRIPAELSLTPLIDVVFLLLVFFMLTSSMVKIKTIDLNLPDSSSADSLPEEPINISVNKAGDFFLGETIISNQELTEHLIKQLATNPKQNIMLSVDASLTSQEMIDAMDLIRNAGGTNLSIATK